MSAFRRIPMVALAVLAASGPAPAAAGEATRISSDRLEMQGTPSRNFFYFTGSVEVKGTNLTLRCEELTVVSAREGPEGATIGRIGAIEEIVARGNVVIRQAGRTAYAGRADVNPRAGTVVLSDHPRIVDGEVEVTGYQFVLHKGQRTFTSVPDPAAPAAAPSRAVVRLGALPDLGFDQGEEEATLRGRLGQGPAAPEPAAERKGDDGERQP